MRIQNLHKLYDFELLNADVYTASAKKNTFFEMVFILEGKGTQIINEFRLDYGPDKLFLLFPQDVYSFEVEKRSRFFFIRFHQNYLKYQSPEWMKKIEFIILNHRHLPGCILKTVTDKPLVRALVEALIREQETDYPQYDHVVKQLLNTIIAIAARNIILFPKESEVEYNNSQISDILNYLHENIYEPEKLRNAVIARKFNLSPTYVSEYYKIHTGENIQEYIVRYKVKLIETRLKFTDMKIKEIVSEFGFSDASHLNRVFKKNTGCSPSEFKRKKMY